MKSGHGRRIDVAARARAHDQRNLRNDARGQYIALKHLAITAERGHAFLNARAPPASNRPMIGARFFSAISCSLVIFWAWVSDRDPPNTVKSLGEHIDRPAVDRARTRHHAVAWNTACVHAEFRAPVLDEHIDFFKRPLVEQCPRCVRAPSVCRACAAPRSASRPPPRRATSRRFSSSAKISFIETPPSLFVKKVRAP